MTSCLSLTGHDTGNMRRLREVILAVAAAHDGDAADLRGGGVPGRGRKRPAACGILENVMEI